MSMTCICCGSEAIGGVFACGHSQSLNSHGKRMVIDPGPEFEGQTEGSWYAEETPSKKVGIYSNATPVRKGRRLIAYVECGGCPAEQKANAKLLAAAPRLLDEKKELLEALNDLMVAALSSNPSVWNAAIKKAGAVTLRLEKRG